MDGLPSVEKAVSEGDYDSARSAMALRLARLFDSTSSARDGKAIALSLADLLDELDGRVRADMGKPDSSMARMRRKFGVVDGGRAS